jgi:hypothetical protein
LINFIESRNYLAWIVAAAAAVVGAVADNYFAVDNYVVESVAAENDPNGLLIISPLVACERVDLLRALLGRASSSLTLLTF